jgi:hypothetical protein
MVGNCCSSVEFQTTCFGEEILRAPMKGAVGYIGGSNSTYWDEDFWWGVGLEPISANPTYHANKLGAYDRTFHDQSGLTTDDWFITQGQMPSAGNLAVSQSGSYMEEYYWEIYHLMGDPSLMIYFSQPPAINAGYPATIQLGAENFTVTCEPYAYVAISKDGVLHGAALADASGEAVVNIDPFTEPGEFDIVITGQNLQPHFGTATVLSTGLQSQSISIPEGWSGLSSCLIPENTGFNQILGLHLQDVVLIQDMNGVFYPEYQVNTIGEWDYQSGYMIKAENPFVLEISGEEPEFRQITLEAGWNIMPVLSDCNATVGQLFGLYLNKIKVIKSIAGTEVFWPQFNINTLGSLEPGNAYFVNVSQAITITFPECD